MKTILEIQKLDRQIRSLEREVDKCPASIDFKNYKKFLQEGKAKFENLERQADEIIKNYEKSSMKLAKSKGESDILKKRNVAAVNLENASALVSEVNALLGSVSEENRRMEDLVRKSEEIVRKSAELSNKLTEAKMRANSFKAKIEEKKQEIAPKIEEIQKKIKELEPNVQDVEKYEKYKEMKLKGIFPVYVTMEDVFCGGCKVELPLNFLERLKDKKMLPCEHCGRIICFSAKN